MFYDPATNSAFGSLGWVDHGTVWCCDLGSNIERRIVLPDVRYVSVHQHAGGLLRVIHHGEQSTASVRACAAPELELASLRSDASGWRFHGDSTLWGETLAFLMKASSGQTELLLVDGSTETVRRLDLSWFNSENYDLDYQGLVDCLALPDLGVVVVAVQRSSELVLIDPDRNERIGTIQLADRWGNPELRFLSRGMFLASDYDTLCLVDGASRSAECSPTLQPPSPSNTHQFIGGYDLDETVCVVARPYSGDVVRLEIGTFVELGRVSVPGQPFSICLTSDRSFLTRDWQTGKLESGQFS